MRVRFASAAISDLQAIRAYISRDSPDAAYRVASSIVSAIDHLINHPRQGRPGPDDGTFELIIRPYVVVYDLQPAEIIILRVWHGRQERS